MRKLDGKVAVVTGGNSGIGLEIARSFVRQGARVVITGRRQTALDNALSIIGGDVVAFQGDVADLAHHAALREFVKARFGKVDIYVANAGVNTITHSADVTEAEFDQQFDVNARGTFFGVQSIAPILNDGASVIVVGSLASEKNLDGHAVYAGSKAAITAFAKAWAIEFKDRNIRVNILSPGPTDTAILDKLGVSAEQRPEFEAMMAKAIPLGRFGRPEELANAALFLASDDSSFVTGINLRVDGGMALA